MRACKCLKDCILCFYRLRIRFLAAGNKLNWIRLVSVFLKQSLFLFSSISIQPDPKFLFQNSANRCQCQANFIEPELKIVLVNSCCIAGNLTFTQCRAHICRHLHTPVTQFKSLTCSSLSGSKQRQLDPTNRLQ